MFIGSSVLINDPYSKYSLLTPGCTLSGVCFRVYSYIMFTPVSKVCLSCR